ARTNPSFRRGRIGTGYEPARVPLGVAEPIGTLFSGKPEAGEQERAGEPLQSIDGCAVSAGCAGQGDAGMTGRAVRSHGKQQPVGEAGEVLTMVYRRGEFWSHALTWLASRLSMPGSS